MKNIFLTGMIIMLLSAVAVAQVETTDATTTTITAEGLLDQIRQDLTALQANFVQYEIDANDIISEKLHGQVWLQKPSQFKWEYAQPTAQLIVANGKTVWIYDADLEQVTIKKQQNTQNPIYVLLNKQDTEENFNLTLLDQEAGQHDQKSWIEMTPKELTDEIKTVWIGVENNSLSVIKLKNQMDNIVVFEFDSIHKNPELSPDFFTFNIPKGVDVIRDSGFSVEF